MIGQKSEQNAERIILFIFNHFNIFIFPLPSIPLLQTYLVKKGKKINFPIFFISLPFMSYLKNFKSEEQWKNFLIE